MTDIGTSEATAPPVTGTQNTVRADFVDVGKRETLAGGILVGITMVAALFFRWHPGPIFLDRWGFSLVHPAIHNSWWIHVTYLRATPVLVGGSILAAVIVAGRDRWRALACLVAPTVAVMLTELVLKPEIARRYAHVLTFPSGTTTIVSAVVMAFIIAVPTRIRCGRHRHRGIRGGPRVHGGGRPAVALPDRRGRRRHLRGRHGAPDRRDPARRGRHPPAPAPRRRPATPFRWPDQGFHAPRAPGSYPPGRLYRGGSQPASAVAMAPAGGSHYIEQGPVMSKTSEQSGVVVLEHPDRRHRRLDRSPPWSRSASHRRPDLGDPCRRHALRQIGRAVRADDRVCPISISSVAVEFGSVASAVPLQILGARLARAIGPCLPFDHRTTGLTVAVGMAAPG